MRPSIIPVAGRSRWLRMIACCLAVSIAPAAVAGKNLLYKCVSAAGVTSIQSVACPAGSKEEWRRDATPEPPPTPEQLAQAEAKLLRDQQTVRELSEIVDKKLQPQAPTPEPAPPAVTAAVAAEQASVDACQSAQAFAGEVREKAWLGLTGEQTRRLYTWVAEQCKTPPKAD